MSIYRCTYNSYSYSCLPDAGVPVDTIFNKCYGKDVGGLDEVAADSQASRGAGEHARAPNEGKQRAPIQDARHERERATQIESEVRDGKLSQGRPAGKELGRWERHEGKRTCRPSIGGDRPATLCALCTVPKWTGGQLGRMRKVARPPPARRRSIPPARETHTGFTLSNKAHSELSAEKNGA